MYSTLIRSQYLEPPARPTYKDALVYLNSLQTDHATLKTRRNAPRPNLQQSDLLLEMQQCAVDIGYTPFDFDRLNAVHVAGTKGKGSTCAYVNSILQQYQQRYGVPSKIGLYTSPHLLSVCERIRINSLPISEEKFTTYFFDVWSRLTKAASERGIDPRLKPAYFRYLTLLSFHAFVKEGVNVAVYEVGVGGEFDSTNIIVNPSVTGITSLGIDHVEVLGRTIEEIAWHKAGIMKTGAPAYTVQQSASAMQVLENRAAEKGVTLQEVMPGSALASVDVRPAETYQKSNAALATVLAARALARFDLSSIDSKDRPQDVEHNLAAFLSTPVPELFKTGLESTVWRGRGEVVEKDYAKWLIDGAHTKESLEIVSDWYGRTIQEARIRGEDPLCILLFNQQASTRNAKELIDTVQQRLLARWNVRPHEAIFSTNVTYRSKQYRPDFVDRGTDPKEVEQQSVQHAYAESWKAGDPDASTSVVPSIEEATDKIEILCKAQTGRSAYVLATGSFRLIGGVLAVLQGEEIAQESSSSTSRSSLTR